MNAEKRERNCLHHNVTLALIPMTFLSALLQLNNLAFRCTVGISVAESFAQIEFSQLSVKAVDVPLKD
jgi:hypothetical protein